MSDRTKTVECVVFRLRRGAGAARGARGTTLPKSSPASPWPARAATMTTRPETRPYPVRFETAASFPRMCGQRSCTTPSTQPSVDRTKRSPGGSSRRTRGGGEMGHCIASSIPSCPTWSARPSWWGPGRPTPGRGCGRGRTTTSPRKTAATLDDCTTSDTLDVEDLREPHWPAEEAAGWEMAAVASQFLGADAVYRAPMDHLSLFLLLRNIRRAADVAE